LQAPAASWIQPGEESIVEVQDALECGKQIQQQEDKIEVEDRIYSEADATYDIEDEKGGSNVAPFLPECLQCLRNPSSGDAA